MKITDTFRAALRRIAGTRAPERRRTLAVPSILNTYGPRPDVLPKPTPANLRRFSETPIARKAINTIKDRIAGMAWRIQPANGRALAEIEDGAARIRALTDNLDSEAEWGPQGDRNLLGRFTTQAFTVTRLTRLITYYLRQYDGSTPPKYSRYSTALHVDYPL